MKFTELFNKECKHDKFSVEKEIGYCPDCGELIENQWYIMRCSCCGVKHKAIYKRGKIQSVDKFCNNCGGNDFTAERIEKINFIDINYAVLVKTIISSENNNFTQCWVDSTETPSCKPRLLTQSL